MAAIGEGGVQGERVGGGVAGGRGQAEVVAEEGGRGHGFHHLCRGGEGRRGVRGGRKSQGLLDKVAHKGVNSWQVLWLFL